MFLFYKKVVENQAPKKSTFSIVLTFVDHIFQ
jgi:hypothetical protein